MDLAWRLSGRVVEQEEYKIFVFSKQIFEMDFQTASALS